MDIEKYSRFASLFEVYKELLTEKQRDIVEKYLNYDLSLSELSKDYGISRAAASDTVSKVLQKIENYENKLGILKNKAKITKIKNETKDIELKEKLEDYLNGI